MGARRPLYSYLTIDIDLETGPVSIDTPPLESTGKKSSLIEAMFSAYSGMFEPIGLPIHSSIRLRTRSDPVYKVPIQK